MHKTEHTDTDFNIRISNRVDIYRIWRVTQFT
jgi:hypothetical protein